MLFFSRCYCYPSSCLKFVISTDVTLLSCVVILPYITKATFAGGAVKSKLTFMDFQSRFLRSISNIGNCNLLSQLKMNYFILISKIMVVMCRAAESENTFLKNTYFIKHLLVASFSFARYKQMVDLYKYFSAKKLKTGCWQKLVSTKCHFQPH